MAQCVPVFWGLFSEAEFVSAEAIFVLLGMETKRFVVEALVRTIHLYLGFTQVVS